MKAAVCKVIIGRGVHSYIVEMTLGVLWMPSGASWQGLGKAGSRPLQLPGVRKPRCMLRQWTLICGSVPVFRSIQGSHIPFSPKSRRLQYLHLTHSACLRSLMAESTEAAN